MITFHVDDMSCGHCVKAITQAVTELDPAARVAIDLASHQVQIGAATADTAALQAAIAEAGYSPRLATAADERLSTAPGA